MQQEDMALRKGCKRIVFGGGKKEGERQKLVSVALA